MPEPTPMPEGDDLEALEKLARAATPGPYHVEVDPRGATVVYATRSGDDDKVLIGVSQFGPPSWREANASYIAAACSAAPGLIARIRALEAARSADPAAEAGVLSEAQIAPLADKVVPDAAIFADAPEHIYDMRRRAADHIRVALAAAPVTGDREADDDWKPGLPPHMSRTGRRARATAAPASGVEPRETDEEFLARCARGDHDAPGGRRYRGPAASPAQGSDVGLREALEAVLNTSGARGTYHAIKYGEAVEAAEALLAASRTGQKGVES